MGQAADRPSRDVLDTVITNALVVDAIVGIVKGDIGIKVSTSESVISQHNGVVVYWLSSQQNCCVLTVISTAVIMFNDCH